MACKTFAPTIRPTLPELNMNVQFGARGLAGVYALARIEAIIQAQYSARGMGERDGR